MRAATACLLVLLTAGFDGAAGQTFAGWSTIETPHFRFHFPPGATVDRDTFAKGLEAAYAELQQFFAADLPGKIEFYAWNDGAEASKILARPVGFAEPERLLVHAAVNQTRGHELAHVLAYHAARPERTTRFLDEGTAAAFDLSGRDRLAAAQAAAKRAGARPPVIAFLWTRGGSLPEDVVYPIAGAFVEHLVREGGRERFLRLLERQTLEEARATYGDDFDRIVNAFESRLTGLSIADIASLTRLRERAQARMRLDADRFTAEQLRHIEALYQPANRSLRAPEVRASLVELLEKYPKANRAGCAMLYLAQISSGAEREAFLKRAIDEYSDSWYGDGVQVGALARAFLARHYAETGRRDDALSVADDVRRSFPDAVDHSGGRLSTLLQQWQLAR